MIVEVGLALKDIVREKSVFRLEPEVWPCRWLSVVDDFLRLHGLRGASSWRVCKFTSFWYIVSRPRAVAYLDCYVAPNSPSIVVQPCFASITAYSPIKRSDIVELWEHAACSSILKVVHFAGG